MTALNHSTRRRLQNLPQIPSVWEGDRRPLSAEDAMSQEWADPISAPTGTSECILWVDGSQGFVRAMDMVTLDTGPEAIVRTLLRAMEHPHSPAQPARPQKIVVNDRELKFYLRGVLQTLDITIEYVPELPLIDEIFRGFQDVVSTKPPHLPPQYAEVLTQKAYDIWRDAPWELLGDHQILSVELNQWDVETLYLCVLGMLGVDYGILLYRSIDSLKRFRQRVLANDSINQLEEAFLGQDCLFLSFESIGDVADEYEDDFDLADLPLSEIQPTFGNLHPLEGLRSFLYEEEALTAWVALEALHRFLRSSRQKLGGEGEALPKLNSRYRIPLPTVDDAKPSIISVKVATQPELESELLEMANAADEEDDEEFDGGQPLLRDDLVPANSFLSLGVVPWETVEFLRTGVDCYQSGPVTAAGEGLPVVLIQTSRPKAKAMIQELQEAGGLKAICFNRGEDSFDEVVYDLGILQTDDGQLHLFGEFIEDDPVHVAARKKWDQRCKKTKGYCGLIIAQGLTGASRGNPKLKDMLALFEVRSLSAKDLGLGPLQLIPQLE
ncbi:DUF6930 domain-containing protein [Microcoleus sp. FACHB-672]|uniref:DUF6930 domain-containing protein n=1 Tax=Microcoleus sp. FACHB-672 TaxID=2692825 RepID=UPI001687360F|nr:hypothetical protein [Microcoleus sp. FACHB-672]MBD2043170.1 hypothetical protein [Microcoleus sp. FACHB-672]